MKQIFYLTIGTLVCTLAATQQPDYSSSNPQPFAILNDDFVREQITNRSWSYRYAEPVYIHKFKFIPPTKIAKSMMATYDMRCRGGKKVCKKCKIRVSINYDLENMFIVEMFYCKT